MQYPSVKVSLPQSEHGPWAARPGRGTATRPNLRQHCSAAPTEPVGVLNGRNACRARGLRDRSYPCPRPDRVRLLHQGDSLPHSARRARELAVAALHPGPDSRLGEIGIEQPRRPWSCSPPAASPTPRRAPAAESSPAWLADSNVSAAARLPASISVCSSRVSAVRPSSRTSIAVARAAVKCADAAGIWSSAAIASARSPARARCRASPNAALYVAVVGPPHRLVVPRRVDRGPAAVRRWPRSPSWGRARRAASPAPDRNQLRPCRSRPPAARTVRCTTTAASLRISPNSVRRAAFGRPQDRRPRATRGPVAVGSRRTSCRPDSRRRWPPRALARVGRVGCRWSWPAVRRHGRSGRRPGTGSAAITCGGVQRLVAARAVDRALRAEEVDIRGRATAPSAAAISYSTPVS